MSQRAAARQRYPYLDLLRIIAAFLVIVNHTNSLVFKALSPGNLTWWFSIAWYYLSKIAVPLFVMVSGACLLSRRDSYRQALWRFLRVLITLVLFSYAYYLVAVAQGGWTWAKALDIPGFLLSIWKERITDSFWYLYFYLGLMVMLPILQRLAASMQKADYGYLIGISFLVYAVWPLATHYVPALALPAYFDVPVFAVFVGLFFAGHYVNAFAGRANRLLCLLAALATVAASVWLTYVEFGRTGGTKYWFMDERTAPSVFVIGCALAVMLWAKAAFERRAPLDAAAVGRFAAVGGCAFGIYLLQDLIIAETRLRVFVPLRGPLNPFVAALVWEVLVFLIAFAVAWLLKHVPLLKRLL